MSETKFRWVPRSARRHSPIGKARSLHSFFTSPFYVAFVTTAGAAEGHSRLETIGKEW